MSSLNNHKCNDEEDEEEHLDYDAIKAEVKILRFGDKNSSQSKTFLISKNFFAMAETVLLS